MWVDVSLIVSLLGGDAARRAPFTQAMERRGWVAPAEHSDTYRVAFREAPGDEEIVRICTRDVQESAYVAGVANYQATCLIAPGQESSSPGVDPWDSDGDMPRPHCADSDDA